MAEPLEAFEQILQKIRARDPGARGFLKSEWRTSDFARRAIRQSVADTLSDWRHDDRATLFDLMQPPRPHVYSISISHAQEWGGWMAVPRPAQIGFDIEKKSRIERRVIERVCSHEDLSAAPDAAYLWPAKEAFFKALEDEQPQVMSQLAIDDWRRDGGMPALWLWRGLGPRNSEGILIDAGEWLLAACYIG